MAKNNATVDRVQAVWNKLGGEEGVDRLLCGDLKLVEVQPREFAVWKTVKLGLHKSPKDYRAAIKSAKMKIGDWGDDILGRITCLQEEVDLDLVIMSVGDLGFKGSACYADICAKAVELGLELCPAEVGPALRLQYGDQPRDEWLRIAMEAITDRDGGRGLFCVGHGSDGFWLDARNGHPGNVWIADIRFVFARRK